MGKKTPTCTSNEDQTPERLITTIPVRVRTDNHVYTCLKPTRIKSLTLSIKHPRCIEGRIIDQGQKV